MGEQKTIRVNPKDAYGPINPKAFQEVSREKMPSDQLQVGNTIMARNPQGQSFPVRVREINEKTVVLDLSHPLAGKTLTFDVTIVAIKPVQQK